MAARSTLLCLALATSLSAQESKSTSQPLDEANNPPTALTAADRIDILRAELSTLEKELIFLKELKAKGGRLLRLRKTLADRKHGFRVHGKGIQVSDIIKPRKAVSMDTKHLREGSPDLAFLVNDAPVMRQDIDSLVYYLKSYPRPESHAQIMAMALAAIIDQKAIESAMSGNLLEARIHIGAVQKQLAAGADFAELAGNKSQAESSAKLGEMALIGRKGADPILTMHAFTLKVGETSDVIQTLRGFEIIKVIEHIPGDTPNLDKARIRTIVASFVGGPEGKEEIDQVLENVSRGRIDLQMRDRTYTRYLPKIFR